MLRLSCIALLLATLIFCSGCEHEKKGVEVYLEELKQSKLTMNDSLREMQSSMNHLEGKFSDGHFDIVAVDKELNAIIGKVRAEKIRLQGINVPAKANTLHKVVIEQYEVAISILEKTPAVVKLAKDRSELFGKMGKDIKNRKSIVGQMRRVQSDLGRLQAEIVSIVKKGEELGDKAEEQEKILREQFHLAPDLSSARTSKDSDTSGP